jgi:hypothetical protein
MKAKWLITAIAFPMAMFLLFVIGCEGDRGPAGPAGVSPIYIFGRVETPYPPGEDTTGDAFVTVEGLDIVPSVSINNIPIAYQPGGAPLYFEDRDFHIFAGEQAVLEVKWISHDGDSLFAMSNLILPDSFSIISPDPESFTLQLGDSITIQWSSSLGASAYYYEFSVGYDYYDASGNFHSFSFRDHSITVNTHLVLSGSELFPDLVLIDSLQSVGWVQIEVWAISGPVFEGDWGNIEGNGIGFFKGWTFGDMESFMISDIVPVSKESLEPQQFIMRNMRGDCWP